MIIKQKKRKIFVSLIPYILHISVIAQCRALVIFSDRPN